MAALIVISGGRSWTHTLQSSNTIGGSQSADIRLESPELEAVEARIERSLSGYLLSDVTGRGLLRVDGKPVSQHILKAGDKIELGDSCLIFTGAEGRQARTPGQAPSPAVPPAEQVSPSGKLQNSYSLADEQISAVERPRIVPCIYCGNQIPEDVSRCPYCGELLGREARRQAEEEAGPWSLLSDRAMATRGVNLEVIVGWIKEGRINRNSTVRGPATHFEWRYAAEAPVLSKYLGVCPYCQAQVNESQQFCPACRGDLDGKGRLAPELEAQAKRERVERRSNKRTAVLVMLLFLTVVVAFFVTPLWRWVLPRAQESWMQAKLEALAVGFKGLVGPGHFGREKALLAQAAHLERQGEFTSAIEIYEGLIATYADTDFARELNARLGKVKGWRKVRNGINVADNYRRNRMYKQALKLYSELKDTHPDYPLMGKLTERIAETERELASEEGG